VTGILINPFGMNTLVGEGVGTFASVGLGVCVISKVGVAVGLFNDLIRSRYEHPLVKIIVVKTSANARQVIREFDFSIQAMWICDIV
jgi:hypothetical protein